jgi:hypothetical protein
MMSACKNIPHGERSCGNSAFETVGAVALTEVPPGAGTAVGAGAAASGVADGLGAEDKLVAGAVVCASTPCAGAKTASAIAIATSLRLRNWVSPSCTARMILLSANLGVGQGVMFRESTNCNFE